MYRHKIIIQREDTENRISDDQGGYTESWITFADVWAEIETIKGQEVYKAAEFDTALTHRIKTRFIKGIDSKMRIVYGSRVFKIISAIDINEMHRQLEILCVELVN